MTEVPDESGQNSQRFSVWQEQTVDRTVGRKGRLRPTAQQVLRLGELYIARSARI